MFKLTPEQLDAALEAQDITECARKEAITDNESILNCGLYYVYDEPHTNPDQRVYLDKRGYLVVEGQRCALAGDDGYEVAMHIVGKDAVPLVYETSDPRLKWNETLAMYMKARAPLDARIAYVLAGRHHEWRWFLPELEPVVKALKTSAARANAQFDAYMISVGSKLIKETT
jgi:hypothetical protein